MYALRQSCTSEEAVGWFVNELDQRLNELTASLYINILSGQREFKLYSLYKREIKGGYRGVTEEGGGLFKFFCNFICIMFFGKVNYFADDKGILVNYMGSMKGG